MNSINYIGSIVKILEDPKYRTVNNTFAFTEVRAQFPQNRETRIVKLVFLGNLARDIMTLYKVNDYIMVEGYLSIEEKKGINKLKVNLKKAEITISKLYPFFLNSNYSRN